MSNERLGLYEELREKARRFEDREQERKRMLQMGPAWNGAYAMPLNPFSSAIPLRLKQGGYHKHNPDHSRRRRKVYPEAKLGVTIAQVVQAVCLEVGITHGDLFSQHRERRLAYPRHVCMWLIDRYCPEYSLPEVAYLFQRDHTSVLHGIERTTDRLHNKHHETRALVANVKQRLAVLAEGQS